MYNPWEIEVCLCLGLNIIAIYLSIRKRKRIPFTNIIKYLRDSYNVDLKRLRVIYREFYGLIFDPCRNLRVYTNFRIKREEYYRRTYNNLNI